MSTLLVEIGTEELPYKVCESVIRQLEGTPEPPGLALSLLGEQRLLEEGAAARVLVSPRRIAVLVDGVPDEQLAQVQEFRGPKAEIAYAADGTLTKAGAGFARSKGAAAEDIRREVVDGTEFVVVSVEAGRRAARDVVPELVARLITGLQIPRGMRWGAVPEGASDYLRFSRPIRWLVAKLGDETLRGEFYGLPLGDVSQGHRVLGAPVTIADAGDYERLLEDQKVVVSQAERRRRIIARPRRRRRGARRRVVRPGRRAGRGGLPRRVAERGARRLQGAAPAAAGRGPRHRHAESPALLPGHGRRPASCCRRSSTSPTAPPRRRRSSRAATSACSTAASTTPSSPTTATSPRASPPWPSASAPSCSTRSSARSPTRPAASAASSRRCPAGPGARRGNGSGDSMAETLRTAARLAKADLVSQVVIEFPVLQGVMGGLYAEAGGLGDAVARAVGEHYRPLSATAPLPGTVAGALLAVADKLDNIAGAWVAGEKPSGSRDPYGLRRAAMGIVRIALEFGLRFPLAGLLAAAVDQFELQGIEGLDDARRAAIVAETGGVRARAPAGAAARRGPAVPERRGRHGRAGRRPAGAGRPGAHVRGDGRPGTLRGCRHRLQPVRGAGGQGPGRRVTRRRPGPLHRRRRARARRGL